MSAELEPWGDFDEAEAFTRSWQPVDLSAVLDGSWTPPEAVIGKRADGVGLFYAGKVHTIASESEAGKTWLMLSACIDELLAGNHVVYLDFEDDEGGLVRRLLGLQCRPEVIRERFHYVKPSMALGTGINADDLRGVMAAYKPSLTVIDGVTEAMTMHGMDPLSNKDIATFGRMLPRSLAACGTAVVCLDHVVKSGENRGRYALGGVHKLNGLDGAAFVLQNRKPFGIGLTGISTIFIAKDRPGQLRKNGLPGREGMFWFGDLKLTSHGEDFLEVEVIAPEKREEGEFRPTAIMGLICAALEKHGPLSAAKIEAVVRGKAVTIRQARNLLQIEGFVSDGTPHALLKPWTDGGSE